MIEVYGEFLFLENFLMNFIILDITSYFGKYQGGKFKIVIGAVVSALYSFIIFFPSLHFMLTFFMKFTISMFIIVITFTPNKFKEFLKYLSVFYLTTFIFGGAAFGFFYFTNFDSLISNGIFYTNNFTIRILLYSVAIAYILILISINLIKYKISKETLLRQITIEFDNKKKEIQGLIDTGNSLADPISKFPVVIVEYEAIKDILPDSIKEIFSNNKFSKLDNVMDVLGNSNWINRFRVIPYTSLGKTNGMLIGFKPDNVELINEGEIISINKIIIGISIHQLSQNGDYRALLNPDILV